MYHSFIHSGSLLLLLLLTGFSSIQWNKMNEWIVVIFLVVSTRIAIIIMDFRSYRKGMTIVCVCECHQYWFKSNQSLCSICETYSFCCCCWWTCLCQLFFFFFSLFVFLFIRFYGFIFSNNQSCTKIELKWIDDRMKSKPIWLVEFFTAVVVHSVCWLVGWLVSVLVFQICFHSHSIH